jgi:hypothetical protein
MNPMPEGRSLSVALRASLIVSRGATGPDNRPHDGGLGYVDGSIPVSVTGEAALDTTENSLALAVRFCTVPTSRARLGRVAWVDRMQWDASKSGFVREEETELEERPVGMARTLRPFYRAISARPNVSKVFNRYSLPVGFGLLNNPFGDDMIRIALESGLLAREFLEMPLCALCAALLKTLTQGSVTLARLLKIGFPSP